jgi:penicillin amidase
MESINIWKKVTPIEFQLVGVKKEKFTIKKMYNIFDTCRLVLHGKTDPLLTDIRNKYGMST